MGSPKEVVAIARIVKETSARLFRTYDTPALELNHDPLARARWWKWETHQGQDDDDDEKRQTVDTEAGRKTKRDEDDAPDQRTDHLGEVELDRVQRDRVRERRAWNERRDHRLERRSAKGLSETGHE